LGGKYSPAVTFYDRSGAKFMAENQQKKIRCKIVAVQKNQKKKNSLSKFMIGGEV
jgi:hypothetical protein